MSERALPQPAWTDKPGYEPAPPVRMNPWYIASLLDGRSDHDSYVYLVESDTHYKIGITTNMNKRLAAFNHASGSRIALVALRHGGRDIERLLHEALAEYRTQGEWFDKCDAVRDRFYALATAEVSEQEPESSPTVLPLFDDEDAVA